jgi:hypothetical protein
MASRIFIHVPAAFAVFVPFATAAFLSLVGLGVAFAVPHLVGWGAATGAVVGTVVGAVAARLSTPKDKR